MKHLDFNELLTKLSSINFDDKKEEQKIRESLQEIFSTSYFNQQDLESFLEETNNTLLNNNLQLHKQYSDSIENYNKALILSIEKNKDQIDRYIQDAENKISEIQKQIISEKRIINQRISEEQKKNEIALEESAKIYEDEVNQINNEIKEKSDNINLINQRNENEKNLKLEQLQEEFDVEFKLINEQSTEIKNRYAVLIKDLNDELKVELTNKDEVYLGIKKTYTQSSVKFNDFINLKKDEYKKVILKNIESSKAKLLELDKQIELENTKHLQNKDAILQFHLEKTKALNIVFDVQKDVYNQKTSEIINDNNDTVTKINQVIRQKREMIDEKIKLLEKEKWQKQSKSTSIEEKSRINKEYNKIVNKLKKELIELTFKNKQELSKQDIIFQTNLFNHDYEHVKQINEWRYSKNLYDSERKRDQDLEVNRYNHEIFILEKKKILTEKILKEQQEIERINLDKILLPVESQIFFASSLQNREINLLNLEFESYKLDNQLNKQLLETKASLEEQALKYHYKKLEIDLEYNKKIINVQYQLEIEKNILQRNHEIDTLKLNLKLQEDLLNQKNNRLEVTLNSIIKSASLNIEILNNNFTYQSKKVRQVALSEEKKRHAIMQEIRIKNQFQINNTKTTRSIIVAKNDTEARSKINEYYFNKTLELYYNEEKLYKLLLELISLPAHPETVRQLTIIMIEALNITYESVIYILDLYYKNDKKASTSQLETLSDYKYRIKHEEIIDAYNDNIRVVNERKNDLVLRLDSLNEEKLLLINKSKQNYLLIDVYRKNKKSNKDESQEQQLKTLKIENKNIKDSIKKLTKLQKKFTKDLVPFNKTLERFIKEKNDNEKMLEMEINQDQVAYKHLLTKHNRSYLKVKKTLLNHNLETKKIYSQLLDKPFLNDQLIESTKKKFELIYQSLFSNLIQANQKLLSFWLNSYLTYKNEQEKTINQFEYSSNAAVEQIKKTFNRFLLTEDREINLLTQNYKSKNNQLENKLAKNKNDTQNKIKQIIDNYNNLYSLTEKRIADATDKNKYQIQLTSDNLTDVLTNLGKNYENDSEKLKRNNDKSIIKTNNNITSIKNEIDDNINKTNTRTNIIINKYENERKIHLKNMNAKRIRFINNINKSNKTIEHLTIDYKIKVNENLKLVKKANKDIEQKLKQFIVKNRKDRHKLTNKERSALKKSYRFKAKQIKAETRR